MRCIGTATGLLALAASTLVAARPAAAISQVSIGVISPLDGGRSSRAGRGHEDSIRLAYAHLNKLDRRRVHVNFLFENDDGEPARAAELAHKLVEQDGVAAIIGPVNSSCVKRVLDLDLKVPIIATMSTAPITGARDPWFFRMTVDDRERMKQYAAYVDKDAGLRQGPHLLLYEDDPAAHGDYGLGLKTALEEFLQVKPTSMGWSEIQQEATPDAAGYRRLEIGEGFTPEFVSWLASPPENIFILGTSEGSLAIAHGLEAILRRQPVTRSVSFLFVGSGKDVLAGAPEGSVTIGDLVLDMRDADFLREQGVDLFHEFEERQKNDPENFVLTAYEAAYYVVPQAVEAAIRRQGDHPDVAMLRDGIRQALENESFASLTPWRKIQLSDGRLGEAAVAPIYRVHRHLDRDGEPPPTGWVKLTLPAQRIGFLLEPANVRLDAHLLDASRAAHVRVLRVEPSGASGPVEREGDVSFTGGAATYTFRPMTPGRYRIETTNLDHFPSDTIVDVFPNFRLYVLSLGGALAGGLIAVYLAGVASTKLLLARVGIGVLVGVLMTLLTFLGGLPSLIQAPTPDGPSELVVLVTGLVGGSVGPHAIAILPGVGKFFTSIFGQKG